MTGPSWARISSEDDDDLLEGVAGSAAEEREYFKSLQKRRGKFNRSGNSRDNRRGNFIKIASLGILALLLLFNVYFHNHKDKVSSILSFSESSDTADDDTSDNENMVGMDAEVDLTDDAQLWNEKNDDGLLFEKSESDSAGVKPKRIERISILGERNTKETELIVNLMNCFPDLEVREMDRPSRNIEIDNIYS